MDQLKEMGEFVRSASSTIEAPVVRRLKEAFTAKAADQPAQGNQAGQAGQGSRPRPGRGARGRGGGRCQAEARRWHGAGGSGWPRRPRRRRYRGGPHDRARRDGERLRGARGRARRCRRERHLVGTRRGRQAAAAGPAVAGLRAGRTAASGQPRCLAGARAAAHSGHPGRLPQSGRGAVPAPGAASQRAGRCCRATSRRLRWSRWPPGPGRQAVRAQARRTWCPPSGGAQARCTGPALGSPASRPAAG